MTRNIRRLAVTAATAGLGLSAGASSAATLFVANNGVDSATCGAAANPCRSISRAIANASAHDRIVVGPGRYGDLNGNGILGEPGEETGGLGCSCLVYVGKPLTLESEEGAAATVLETPRGTLVPYAPGLDVLGVGASASGSVIGKPGKGFTFSGGWHGLWVNNDPYPSTLSIGGNIATNALEGGFLLHAGVGSYTVTDNLAILNGSGGFGAPGGVGHRFRGNAAIANGLDGFAVFGTGGGHEFVNNVAIGNGQDGYWAALGVTGVVYRGNSAIGNKRSGWGFADGASATLTRNNIYGNGSNCAIAVGGVINAVNNYFGSATGPGADPADDICYFYGSVTYIPFAPKEFPISTVWK
jgi:hypothetical protein